MSHIWTSQVRIWNSHVTHMRYVTFKWVMAQLGTGGTPAYQGPEVLKRQPVSKKLDLYGFAIMLWEMYTSRLPWSDCNLEQMTKRVAVQVRQDSFSCVTRVHIYISIRTHVIRLIPECDETRSYVWYDARMYVTFLAILHIVWLNPERDVTHLHVRHVAFIRLMYFRSNGQCNERTCPTHSYTWHDSLLRVT